MMRVISLGAGVQSTTMALMAAHGEIGPMPDAAIFADTGSEPAPVYEHLRWLMSPNVLPFPVHTTRKPEALHTALFAGTNGGGKRRYAAIPAFLDRGNGEDGLGRRQCTKEYKIEPLLKKQRELLGFAPRKRIPAASMEVWIGISTDEAVRMKPARNAWQVNRWPLIEKRMSRWDCLQWLRRNGYPEPPKSACTFCPYRSDHQWRDLRNRDPAGWQQAVEVDHAIRSPESGYSRHLRLKPYLHRSMKPLDQVDFSTSEERGQPDLFNNDCEGMCGL
ncbi:hypothetical protein [Bradyrhizobium embrapense]|uniref:hypothetical protein n=1 Tax=Bradyrhizobium embrapense TaxID=630921 RepID=UPI00067D9770|nr:hypothetical protein [Bradyrhizobium embrapense]